MLDEGELDIPREFFSGIQVTNRGEPSNFEDGEAEQVESDLVKGMVGGYYEINPEFLHTPIHRLTPLSCAVLAGRAQVSNKIYDGCVDIYTKMTTKLLQSARLNFNEGDQKAGASFTYMYFLAALICLTYQGLHLVGTDGKKINKKDVLKRRAYLIDNMRWDELTLASLGLADESDLPALRPNSPNTCLSRLEHRVIYHCSKGNYSKASKSLSKAAPAPSNADTFEKLAKLHPQESSSSEIPQE